MDFLWGKPKIEICAHVNGVLPITPVWVEVANIVDKSIKLATTKGATLEAAIEGGDIIAKKSKANKYDFELEVYAPKGATKPIADTDGIISANYGVRLTPELETGEGFIIPTAFVQVEDTFSSEAGRKWKYLFEALKPPTGAKIQPYTKAV